MDGASPCVSAPCARARRLWRGSRSSRRFHSHLADLLRAEFGTQGSFLAALAEFDRRRSFRDLGYASLFEYLHRGLKLSRGAAHHRRAAALLLERFPEVLEPIQDGRLCFTTASIVATVLTEVGEFEAPRPVVVPLNATDGRLHITVSREFLTLLRKAKAGESHRNPGATDEHVLKLALEALLEKQSKRKASVPAKVKREVVKRDGGKCQWKLPDGGVCGATVRLEIDHVVPRGKGGQDTVDNCRILCKGTTWKRRARPTATT